MYADVDVDRAIQTAADQFIRRTRCTRRNDPFTITAGQSAVSFALLTNFRAERALRVWIPATVAYLDLVDHAEITRAQIACPATGSKPDRIGFDTPTTAELYPTPSANYTGSVMWVEPLTAWTPGGTDPGTLNLPDDLLRSVLSSGAAYELQKNEPEHAKFTVQRLAEFNDFIKSNIGAGGTGAKVALRYREA